MGKKEIWVPIHGWEKKYHVSNMGRIKSFSNKRGFLNKCLKPFPNERGYSMICFQTKSMKKYYTVHRIVLETFIGERPNKYQGCHNNGNKTDNKLTNLRWDTVKNNHKDKINHGTYLFGEKNPHSKLTEKQVLRILKMNKNGMNIRKISKIFYVSISCIKQIIVGINWKHLSKQN